MTDAMQVPGSTSVEGMTAFVVGGAGGVGSSLARELVRQGARVAIADNRADVLERVASEIGAFPVLMDLTDEGSVKAGVDLTVAELGSIQALFNIAGITGGDWPLLDVPIETMADVFDVNVMGTLLSCQVVARHMIAEGINGAIVNCGSGGGIRPAGLERLHYAISKTANHALTVGLAREFAQYGIRVNSVAPGPIFTGMGGAPVTKNPEFIKIWESRVPLKRIAYPEDLVPLFIFLATDAARYMTGAVIANDGGATL